ncbi:MAG: glucose-6-phosphate dehydrogenase, partial [Desulfobaccales bacterium]
MGANIRPEPTVFVIFGAAGDLSWRKLIPAIYSLYVDGWLPEKFRIIGTGHQHMEEEAFHSHLKTGVDKYARRTLTEEDWSRFAAHLTFMTADLEKPEMFAELARTLADQDREWNARANRIFYLSLPPTMIEPVARELARVKLNQDRVRDRIVVEKPFGRDLDSARALNHNLTELFHESQIFRIDHYLGKETVQNIIAFRFANTLFEPVWNRNYIDHVQITVAEAEGVGSRGHYYDQAGALRDMIQNHLLQILCLIAMEPPVSFSADEIRNKKADVLHAIRPIYPEQVFKYAVRGQYAAGSIESQHVDAYRGEINVAPDSGT